MLKAASTEVLAAVATVHELDAADEAQAPPQPSKTLSGPTAVAVSVTVAPWSDVDWQTSD